MSQSEFYHHGIRGMKWGVRRYQNADGTLTAAGQKRYDRDKREQAAKKKDSRIDVTEPDPKRWVQEDMSRSKKVIDTSSDIVKQMQSIERESSPKPIKKTLNLSKMSDKDLRDKINRELLEQQYNKLFAETEPVQISKGRQYLKDGLEVAGGVLAVTSSALAIALAIKELKG